MFYFSLTRSSSSWLATHDLYCPPFQKCNHFPASFELGRKDNLARNLARMKRTHGAPHFDFIPESYLLPAHYNLLANEFEHFQADRSNKKEQLQFIVKPKANSCGRGIKIIDSISQITRRSCIVQVRNGELSCSIIAAFR